MTATIEIRAPSEQTEGTRSQVQRWLKAVGDAVVENEPLIELETDKVTIEIPAPAGGVLAEILKQEQDEIAPGELLGRIQAGAESSVGTKVIAAPAQEVAQVSAVDDEERTQWRRRFEAARIVDARPVDTRPREP